MDEDRARAHQVFFFFFFKGHSHDHLLAAQQRVADELASSEGDGGVVVRHFCRLS